MNYAFPVSVILHPNFVLKAFSVVGFDHLQALPDLTIWAHNLIIQPMLSLLHVFDEVTCKVFPLDRFSMWR